MADRRARGAKDGAAGTGPDEAALLGERYRRLEIALVDAATAALLGTSLPDDRPLVSAETALKLLALRGASGGATPVAALDPEQLRLNLTARILAVRHALPRPADTASNADSA